MNNTRRIETGIEIIPKMPLASDSMGELEVDSSNGKLNYHNGTTRSPVLTESQTATITGKTIDGDDNTIQDLALFSLKTVLGDANKLLKRDASGIVVSSDATLDASNNLKIPGTIYAGSSSIGSSAIVQFDSTTKGALFPRMTTAQRNAISSPANGLVIFNTDSRIFEYYDSVSSSWAAFGSGSGGVVLTFQESLGTGDGVTTSFGPLTNVPNSEESVLVTIDGIVEDESRWSLSGSTITFTIAPAAAQNIYVYYMYGAGPGGGGEANTSSNLGTGSDGEGWASAKVGVDLPFKRIKAGTNITLTPSTNSVEVATTAEINTASNVGSGEGVFKQKSGVDLQFKSLIAGSGVTLTPGTNDITIATTSSSGPTITRLTSGSGTYTTPALVKYIRLRMIGGGGGGSASGGVGAGNGGAGGNTTFGASLTAGGGSGGTISIGSSSTGGTGGTNTISTGTTVVNASGGSGHGGALSGSISFLAGGAGGSSYFGGAGASTGTATSAIAGEAGKTNTGGGGQGGCMNVVATTSGAGGGAGGYIEVIITSPASSYSYSVGAAGAAGASGGGSNAAGGAGGSGIIIVEEYY